MPRFLRLVLRAGSTLALASAASAAELVVNWAPLAARVDGYQIERKSEDAQAEFMPVARVAADATRFVDRAVTAGVRYCYRVRGVRAWSVSPPSAPLCNVAAERGADPTASVRPAPTEPAGEPGTKDAQVAAGGRTSAEARSAPATPEESATGSARGAPSTVDALSPGQAAASGATRGDAIAASSGISAASESPSPPDAPRASGPPTPEAAPARLASAAPAAAFAREDPSPEISPETAAATARPAPVEVREVKALRRPRPTYPPYAQLNGLSGWVKLRFLVAADGTTRDVEVVAAEPPGVFDDVAIDAARQFVYAPRLENGVAVDRPNVETEITFTWIDRGGAVITEHRPRARR